jgi:hypothetical protein
MMIWKEYCALLEDPEMERVTVRTRGWCLGNARPHEMGYTENHRKYNAVPGYLEILLVSKQISKQIEEIFWTTTRFYFDSLINLMGFFMVKRKVSSRGKPFPTHLIRHIGVEFSWEPRTLVADRIYLLRCLWAIAMNTDPALKFECTPCPEWARPSYLGLGFDNPKNPSVFSAMLIDIRGYQARCLAAGHNIRFSKKRMAPLIANDDDVFRLELPADPEKDMTVKSKKVEKESSPN